MRKKCQCLNIVYDIIRLFDSWWWEREKANRVKHFIYLCSFNRICNSYRWSTCAVSTILSHFFLLLLELRIMSATNKAIGISKTYLCVHIFFSLVCFYHEMRITITTTLYLHHSTNQSKWFFSHFLHFRLLLSPSPRHRHRWCISLSSSTSHNFHSICKCFKSFVGSRIRTWINIFVLFVNDELNSSHHFGFNLIHVPFHVLRSTLRQNKCVFQFSEIEPHEIFTIIWENLKASSDRYYSKLLWYNHHELDLISLISDNIVVNNHFVTCIIEPMEKIFNINAHKLQFKNLSMNIQAIDNIIFIINLHKWSLMEWKYDIECQNEILYFRIFEFQPLLFGLTTLQTRTFSMIFHCSHISDAL